MSLDARPDAMDRRTLLRRAGGVALGVAALRALPAGAATAPPTDTLVFVFLRGGLDALNTVVPAAEPRYYTERPTIAVPKASLLALDSSFGMHPSMRPLLPAWLAGDLAFVHATGNYGGDRSHFVAQDVIDCGVAKPSTARTGWIARHIASRPSNGAPLRSMGIGWTTPLSLTGGGNPVSMKNLEDFGLSVGDAQVAAYEARLRELYGGVSHPLAATAGATVAATSQARRIRALGYQPAATASYPATDFGSALKTVAECLKAGVGVEAATIDYDGYDLHTGLGAAGTGQLAKLLTDLASGLAAFRTDLGARMNSVTVVVVSEFGRRLRENGDGGVDHGAGGLLMLLGGGVRGRKVYTRWPGLDPADLDDGDLRVTADWRSVLAEVVARRLGNGANLAKVFPGFTPHFLGVVDPK